MSDGRDLRDVQQRLGGRLSLDGKHWQGPGPNHSAGDLSLKVDIQPDGYPLFISYAGDSFRACADHLGLQDPRDLETGAELVKEARRANEEEAERGRVFCASVWAGAVPAEGTLAERYLASRGVAPGAEVLFHPAAPWGYAAGARRGPAMVALARGAGGVPKGLHVTFLRADATKIERRCFGKVGGAAVRLQPVAATLAVAEGIETALSFAELHGVATWAALSAPSLAAFTVPAGVMILIIAADNDDGGAGLAAARKLAERAQIRCDVEIRAAPGGKDWNDVLRGVGK